MQKPILFQFKEAVTQIGEQIQGLCYVRVPQEISKAQIILQLQKKQYSKIMEKTQIPYDPKNPQMIPEQKVEKQQKIRITLDSPPLQQEKSHKKQYELVNGNTLFRVIRHYGKEESILYTQELYVGTVKQGDYKFPFTIPTVNIEHSSFYYRSDDGMKQGKIYYKLTLRIDLPDEARTLMKESTSVYINKQIKECEQYRKSEGNIVQFLCFNRGTVELTVLINKNSFTPGETMQIQYTIDNTRCQRSVERVEARLIHKLTFIDIDEEERVVEHTNIFNQTLGGVNAGQKVENQIYNLEIPKALKASIKSPQIKNQYYLQVEAIADACLTWLSVRVLCQIPLHIQESQVPQKINLEGWNFVPIMHVSVNAFSNLSVQQSHMG